MTTNLLNQRSLSAGLRVLVVIAAVLPFQSMYVQHYQLNPQGATGFFQYDLPYYVANGREIFERGNGFAHPNPFDPDTFAPTIYFHWFTWLLGFGVTQLGLDPGVLLVCSGFVAGLALSWLTLRIVETVLPDPRYQLPLFLVVMWGGGLFCLTRIGLNVWAGRELWNELSWQEPAHGWWFLSWGRNLIYPTETLYHALVAGIWLAALRGKWNWTLVGVGLLATTHPFSGLQHLGVLGCWFTLSLVRERSRENLARWLVIVAMTTAFLGYYFVFLESYPEHRQLRFVWSQDWSVPLWSLALAYGPLLAVAIYRLRSAAVRREPSVQFLVVAFVVSFLLMKHDWFIAPRQPAHFTRGYCWMPLCLLALPQLQAWLLEIHDRWKLVPRVALVSALLLLASLDNVGFLAHRWLKPDQDEKEQLYLSPNQRAALAWMDQQGWTGILLCSDIDLAYLTATFTQVRPYFGHVFCSPHVNQRKRDVWNWVTKPEHYAWMDQIDYVLLDKRQLAPAAFEPAQWRLAFENDECTIYERRKTPL